MAQQYKAVIFDLGGVAHEYTKPEYMQTLQAFCKSLLDRQFVWTGLTQFWLSVPSRKRTARRRLAWLGNGHCHRGSADPAEYRDHWSRGNIFVHSNVCIKPKYNSSQTLSLKRKNALWYYLLLSPVCRIRSEKTKHFSRKIFSIEIFPENRRRQSNFQRFFGQILPK